MRKVVATTDPTTPTNARSRRRARPLHFGNAPSPVRILFVTPFVPAATARNGGSAYLAALANGLSRHATIGLAALASESAPPAPPWAWLGTTPNPPSQRTSWRGRLGTLWHWRHLPLVAAKAYHRDFGRLLHRAVHEFQPDVALVEMAQMAQYLPHLRPVPTILTDHEAGCAANTRTGLGARGDRRDRRLWQRFVLRYFPQAAALQAVTPQDADALHALLGRPVQARPPTVEVAAQPLDPARTEPRALFLGDYCHGPNPEAAERLATEILPRVRAALPSAELWLAGPNESRIAHLASLPGVRVLGFVADLPALLAQVRLVLAPLWSGHGFRVKVMTALANGLPVVTNGLGARGCTAPSPAVTVAETAADLAAATLHLLQDPAAAGRAGARAHAWAAANLQAEAVAAWQLQRIGELLAQQPA